MVQSSMLLPIVSILLLTSIAYSNKPPNIVLIVADDLGWNDVGWNNRDMITPNLNKLARKGVILNNLYVLPLCSPTRAALLTGYYPYHMGLQHATVPQDFPKFIPEDIALLPEKLKELNYKTHLVGKWHVGNCDIKYTPTRRGFDSFVGYYTGSLDHFNRTVVRVDFEDVIGKYDFRRGTDVYYPTEKYNTNIFGKRAVEIINEHDNKQPLYLQLAFSATHYPLEVPKKFSRLYECVKDKDRRIFSGMVTAMDVEIGNTIKALENNNLMDNTLIIFLSDNGGKDTDGGNNAPFRGGKSTLWEGGTKSAAFVYSKTLLPKIGYRNTRLMHVVDLFPTLLSLAGGKPDVLLDGKDQWPALSSNGESARDEFVYNINEIDENAAIRVGDFKLMEGPPSTNGDKEIHLLPPDNCRSSAVRHWSAKYFQSRPMSRHTSVNKNGINRFQKPPSNNKCYFGKYRLYNISDDPQEELNLACSHQEKLKFMTGRLEFYKESYVTAQELSNDIEFGTPYINDVISHSWC